MFKHIYYVNINIFMFTIKPCTRAGRLSDHRCLRCSTDSTCGTEAHITLDSAIVGKCLKKKEKTILNLWLNPEYYERIPIGVCYNPQALGAH